MLRIVRECREERSWLVSWERETTNIHQIFSTIYQCKLLGQIRTQDSQKLCGDQAK